MSVRTCLALAAIAAALGLALRLVLPVTPVDAAFRDLVRPYQATEPRRD